MDKKDKLQRFKIPGKSILQIKQLLTYRDQLTRISTSLKNSIKSHELYQATTTLDYCRAEIKEQIKDMHNRIKKVQKQIEEIVHPGQ